MTFQRNLLPPQQMIVVAAGFSEKSVWFYQLPDCTGSCPRKEEPSAPDSKQIKLCDNLGHSHPLHLSTNYFCTGNFHS
jgi:hypothetical protein